MKKKKIYSSRPLSYRQWGQIKKEIYTLIYTIAALVLAGSMINVLAAAFVAAI